MPQLAPPCHPLLLHLLLLLRNGSLWLLLLHLPLPPPAFNHQQHQQLSSLGHQLVPPHLPLPRATAATSLASECASGKGQCQCLGSVCAEHYSFSLRLICLVYRSFSLLLFKCHVQADVEERAGEGRRGRDAVRGATRFFLKFLHERTRYDGVQSLTVLEPKIKVHAHKQNASVHTVSWLAQVDLTKYTEQHEFYFDEVKLAARTVLTTHTISTPCSPPTPSAHRAHHPHHQHTVLTTHTISTPCSPPTPAALVTFRAGIPRGDY
jgi:hypothetical protein